jgi:hypothetical protein
LLKTHVADIPGSGNMLDKLWEAVQEVWDGIMPKKIEKHTGKMKDQVDALKNVKSWHTKF